MQIYRLPHSHVWHLGWDDLKAMLIWDCQPEHLHVVWASSQHGSLKLATLLKWWLRAPRVSVPSDQGSSPMVFHTLASEVTWHAPLMEPVTSPLCFKARKQRPHCLMRKACQRICGHILKCHRNESQEINVSPFFLQAKYSAMHS